MKDRCQESNYLKFVAKNVIPISDCSLKNERQLDIRVREHTFPVYECLSRLFCYSG